MDKKSRSRSKKLKRSKTDLKAAWAAFRKYRQELTSKDYRLCHRLRLFSMDITPTLTYASGTWTLSQKHERMIKTAQRRMPRLIVQTKRKCKSKIKKEAADETAEETKNYGEEEKSARLTEKPKRAQIRTLIKIKTAMCPSKKVLKKPSTLLKKIKTGLITSREVPKRQTIA